MTFSGLQIQAIFTLANDMRAADGQMQNQETLPLALFSMNFGLTENDIKTFLSNPMEPLTAIVTVCAMDYNQKKEVRDLLEAIMDADGVRHKDEVKLFNLLSKVCKLPS